MDTDSPYYGTLGRFHFTKRSYFGKNSVKFRQSTLAQKLSGLLGSLMARCRLDGDAGGGSSLLKLRLTTPDLQVLLSHIVVHLKLNVTEMYSVVV